MLCSAVQCSAVDKIVNVTIWGLLGVGHGQSATIGYHSHIAAILPLYGDHRAALGLLSGGHITAIGLLYGGHRAAILQLYGDRP